MSERSKLTHMRLLKEEASLGREPIPNALVTRDGFLNFHFCLHDLDGPYSGGLYHGLFQLHENYPFNAPKLYFYTPSGRFETNLPICTSFTNYHQQTWTSAWNVRSLVLATISFMYSEEPSYGCKSDSEEMRAGYAKDSKRFNFQMIADFDRLFGDKLVKLGKITPEERAQLLGKGKPEKSERSEDREDSEQSVQLEEGERERAEAPMEPLVINEEEQNRQEGNLIPAIKLNQQPLLRKKDPDNNNRRNQFRWSIVKAGVVVVVLVGAYLGYRYFA